MDPGQMGKQLTAKNQIDMDLQHLNDNFTKKSPESIVDWALEQAKDPVITTNFRPYESAILHLVTLKKPDIKVIWCDTRSEEHTSELQSRFDLVCRLLLEKKKKDNRLQQNRNENTE